MTKTPRKRREQKECILLAHPHPTLDTNSTWNGPLTPSKITKVLVHTYSRTPSKHNPKNPERRRNKNHQFFAQLNSGILIAALLSLATPTEDTNSSELGLFYLTLNLHFEASLRTKARDSVLGRFCGVGRNKWELFFSPE